MFDGAVIERLQAYEGRGAPVLSVYLGTRRSQGDAASIGSRLRDLLATVRDHARGVERTESRSLERAIEIVRGHEDRMLREREAGIAVFASADGLDEYQSLPAPFRDRAVVANHPYRRPLDAMLGEMRRYCTVVLDRREAHLMRFFMRQLESTEVLSEEELRKANFGGFSGYDERRVRSHADEVASRHYRGTAGRLFELLKEGAFELLLIGGQHENVDGLRRELRPELAAILAGTFTLDTHTMTPAITREACEPLVEEHDRALQRKLVDSIIDTAKGGGLAVLGLTAVLAAANEKAIEVVAVDTRSSIPGWECTACARLQLESSSGCPACGGELKAVPDLIDEIVRAVMASSGSVRHILASTQLAQYQLGAMLRFHPSIS